MALPWESVEATDKYTVVMKLKEPRLRALNLILDGWNAVIQPPEVIEQYGDMQDWRNIVGTGPYTITDFTKGSSITWTKNPNYWGYDEKYPENRLPYIDTYRALLMPDMSTRLAALRTGKVDMMDFKNASDPRRGRLPAASVHQTRPLLLRALPEHLESRPRQDHLRLEPPGTDLLRPRCIRSPGRHGQTHLAGSCSAAVFRAR